MNESSSYNQNVSSSMGYASATALQIRLDTRPILEDIELFLKGKKILFSQGEDGKITTQEVNIGRAKANEFGIQSILNQVSVVCNPQVVQGYFPEDKWGNSPAYENYIYEVHLSLATNIVNNMYNWEIEEDDIDVIIDFTMSLIVPFMSRLIGNREREGYKDTIKSVESSAVSSQETQKRGLFK